MLIGNWTNMLFETPVVLFVFNRPAFTQQVIDVLAQLRPTKLFVVADGPRTAIQTDILLCAQTRAIIETVNWPCNIYKKYADSNIGCRQSIPSGLDFVFTHVDECIILEDDCVPDLSFFAFCTEMLMRYQDNQSIMTISGHRTDGPNEFDSESYFFSKYPNIWGWATWKNRWEMYDLEMKSWPNLRETRWLNSILPTVEAQQYWTRIFNKMEEGLNTWDYAWVYASWLHHGLTVRPKINMIANIGFGLDATHTTQNEGLPNFSSTSAMEFPLSHPACVEIDEEADSRIEWVSFSGMDARIIANVRAKMVKSMNKRDE